MKTKKSEPAKAKKPAPVKPAAPAPGAKKMKGDKPAVAAPAAPSAKPGVKPAPGTTPAAAGKVPGRKARKGGHRRELDFAPGELLLPGGPHSVEEVQYMLRGAICSERGPAGEVAIEEILLKRAPAEPTAADRAELQKHLAALTKRFDHSAIDANLPARPAGQRRTFQSVIERARYRRREMGAFMRGLDLGRTETSHMDSHGEASLQSLMEWAARLENLVESEEPENADYAQFHRGLDQLENTTEALIIDVEQTLRRLRDKKRA